MAPKPSNSREALCESVRMPKSSQRIHHGVEFPHNPGILGTILFHSSWESLVCNGLLKWGQGYVDGLPFSNWATPTTVKENELYCYWKN